MRIGDNIIKQVADQYRKVRNTLKFISWNLADFDPQKSTTSFEKVDLFILNKLDELTNYVIESFDRYDFSSAMSAIMTYMSSDLSSFYLDINNRARSSIRPTGTARRSIRPIRARMSRRRSIRPS